MVENRSTRSGENTQSSPAAKAESFRDVRHYVPQDILDVSFPAAVRGYDRHAVDAYVKRVNRVIAEVKVSASPPAAVRHALDQAQEKVEALLQAARDAAEEITTSARREADETTGRAKTEAADLMVNTSAEADRMKVEADDLLAKGRADAEAAVAKAKADANEIVSEATTAAQNARAGAQTDAEQRRRELEVELAALQEQADKRLHEIEADTDAVWNRREQLLEDVHAMARTLVELADAAASRVTREGRAEPTTEMPDMSGDEAVQPPVANDEPDEVAPTPEADQGGDETRNDG
jgi:DivIVA domain-containing protein